MFESDLDKTEESVDSSRRGFLIGALGIGAAIAAMAWRRPAVISAEASKPVATDVTIVTFSDSGDRLKKITTKKVVKTDEEWKKQLSGNAYDITRKADTEMAFTGRYWNNHEPGMYRCICCDNALFSSKTKFESGTGWPSFWAPVAEENVSRKSDDSLGMERTEVTCTLCDAHLGHVFDDGPEPTGLRYCMNSASLKFEKA